MSSEDEKRYEIVLEELEKFNKLVEGHKINTTLATQNLTLSSAGGSVIIRLG